VNEQSDIALVIPRGRGRPRVYDNPELVKRIKVAYNEVKNITKLCIKIRQDREFRIKFDLDQESVDKIFDKCDIKAPQIHKISVVKIKNALEDNMRCSQYIEIVSNNSVPSNNPILREHQKLAMEEIGKAMGFGENRGRIVLPTGTGKTRIEGEIIVALIGKNKTSINVVLAPRILLTYQLLDRIAKIISSYSIECAFLNVNSGDFDSERLEKYFLKRGMRPEKIETTTIVEDIKNKILNAKKENKPLTIFSTYNSVGRVAEAVRQTNSKIDAYIYDEAQYCVTTGEFKEIPNLESKYKFFFTATEKYTDDPENGVGMKNEKKFGRVIYTEEPKSLIAKGEMASVSMHLVGAKEDISNDNYESKARITVEAFDKHRNVLKEHSAQPDSIGPKMLVACDTQDSLKGIMLSKCLKEYKEAHPWVKLYALCSDYGIYIEGYGHKPKVSNKDKEDMFACLQTPKDGGDMEDTDEVIIFHVDMIAEGMDIPSITAVLPFRNLGKIKFLQNLGRGTRLLDIDRKNLYDGTIKPKDWKSYIKPYCWLILPVISKEAYDFKKRCQDYIHELRSGGFDTSEMVIIDNIVAPPEEKETDDITGNIMRTFRTGKDIVTEVIQEIEEGETMSKFMEQAFEFQKLTEDEQAQLIADIYKESDNAIQ